MITKASFISKVEANKSNLFLVKGDDEDLECWHYLLLDKVKIPLFTQKMKNLPCTVNLEEYGKVVRSGWGTEPSAELKKQIEGGDYSMPPKLSEYKIMYLANEQDGKPFYAFVAVNWELAEKFEYVANNVGNMDLNDWGMILESGWGPIPEDRIEYYNKLGQTETA